MERYPDKFYIQPVLETVKGGDYTYIDDYMHDEYVFTGRLRKAMGQFNSNIQGDLAKATHTVNCPVLEFDIQIGQSIFCYSDEKNYEILFLIKGQKGYKLWLAQS